MRPTVTIDGNEATASVAHQLNEVIAIYPITPSSNMGEWCDQWSSEGKTNILGTVPQVIEMQSEGGAVAALHGALQSGALGCTFTSAQGLLLMIPTMYKVAGELTPCVIHVAARSIAAQALSIFGDHQDIMAVRQTGFAFLASNNVQEAMDLAAIAQASTLESRIPFVHFFDGFRTSHEVSRVAPLTAEDLKQLIDPELIRAHRDRAMTPDKPVLRGTTQNPDVYFQARETVNPFYKACPVIVSNVMEKFARITGRAYKLFEYVGAPDAERVIVLMGSGADAAQETVDYLTARGEKVGLIKVRLYRPFSIEHFLDILPASAKRIAVLDRTKEPGSLGEPLYQDVLSALHEAGADIRGRVVGGRYGLSSKEFTPAMVKAVFDEIAKEKPKNHFTVGIHDDVSLTSLEVDANFYIEDPSTSRCVFYGLGSDGTVSANKNSIKIIGEETDKYVQGYFVYDSKKAGAITVSHLRFGDKPIRSSYLITRANFVACHQFSFLERIDVLREAEEGATFLLSSPFGPAEVWDHLPLEVQQRIIDKKLRFFVIDAHKVAKETGMGGRINTIMQTCFFALSGVLPREEAIQAIKTSIEKTYGKRGQAVLEKNFAAVDATLANLFEVHVSPKLTAKFRMRKPVPDEAPDFVRNVLGKIIAGEGNSLPVSALPVDGTYPTGTAKWEKRNIAQEVPVWDEKICIQCGKCVLVCPHGTIRAKLVDKSELNGSTPPTFKHAHAHWKEFPDLHYTLQVAVEDCTGCALCVAACPVKNKSNVKLRAINMAPQMPLREQERVNWDHFLKLPEFDREKVKLNLVKDVQLLEGLFEFSGACAGCGETPYIKLMTQMFGDRVLIGNATGCSSIYGGNLPTTPYTVNRDGRGPTWNNSLFEDTAEFGLGLRLALDTKADHARHLLQVLSGKLGDNLVQEILNADQTKEAGIRQQRERVKALREKLAGDPSEEARYLLTMADALVRKSVWIVGGDGWAYDIGFGGLDHVLASGKDVNLLVLDTEVYSNTGGQTSKSTPRGAVAKFSAAGKRSAKKDLAMIAVMHRHVYVARVAMGMNDQQTVKAFLEAEAWPGPSIILAYSHCIAHGYDMVFGLEQQKAAVQSGHWPLLRFNPALMDQGKNPFQLDSKEPSIPLEKYMYAEGRFNMLVRSDPEAAQELLKEAKEDIRDRWRLYSYMAAQGPEAFQKGEFLPPVAEAKQEEATVKGGN
jgi:pyruvate-ferredoxin/flavodoxin oxidoreductase